MTEPSHSHRPSTAAERDKPSVPPMRDAGSDTPGGSVAGGVTSGEPAAVAGGPAMPGGGAVVDPRATDPAHTGKPEPAAELALLKRTRISGLWIGVTVAAVVLLLLLVFIVQNNTDATIYFFGWSFALPLGVALLAAAICGVLLVAIPGYGRILQLRRAARRAAKRP
ncbi:lipopolysaccharide assembly LapA domain-containing protein [Kutzneria sp. NPDC052558]|uniref:lipopolysaccharide assembly LapA domain-containing protein n=1 Tax=Kutzneria sp. NPDC052558 TaxID=3364121 RepID=UPI0037C8EE73